MSKHPRTKCDHCNEYYETRRRVRHRERCADNVGYACMKRGCENMKPISNRDNTYRHMRVVHSGDNKPEFKKVECKNMPPVYKGTPGTKRISTRRMIINQLSDDSDDEPLAQYQQSTASLSDNSEDEPLIHYKRSKKIEKQEPVHTQGRRTPGRKQNSQPSSTQVNSSNTATPLSVVTRQSRKRKINQESLLTPTRTQPHRNRGRTQNRQPSTSSGHSSEPFHLVTPPRQSHKHKTHPPNVARLMSNPQSLAAYPAEDKRPSASTTIGKTQPSRSQPRRITRDRNQSPTALSSTRSPDTGKKRPSTSGSKHQRRLDPQSLAAYLAEEDTCTSTTATNQLQTTNDNSGCNSDRNFDIAGNMAEPLSVVTRQSRTRKSSQESLLTNGKTQPSRSQPRRITRNQSPNALSSTRSPDTGKKRPSTSGSKHQRRLDPQSLAAYLAEEDTCTSTTIAVTTQRAPQHYTPAQNPSQSDKVNDESASVVNSGRPAIDTAKIVLHSTRSNSNTQPKNTSSSAKKHKEKCRAPQPAVDTEEYPPPGSLAEYLSQNTRTSGGFSRAELIENQILFPEDEISLRKCVVRFPSPKPIVSNNKENHDGRSHVTHAQFGFRKNPARARRPPQPLTTITEFKATLDNYGLQLFNVHGEPQTNQLVELQDMGEKGIGCVAKKDIHRLTPCLGYGGDYHNVGVLDEYDARQADLGNESRHTLEFVCKDDTNRKIIVGVNGKAESKFIGQFANHGANGVNINWAIVEVPNPFWFIDGARSRMVVGFATCTIRKGEELVWSYGVKNKLGYMISNPWFRGGELLNNFVHNVRQRESSSMRAKNNAIKKSEAASSTTRVQNRILPKHVEHPIEGPLKDESVCNSAVKEEVPVEVLAQSDCVSRPELSKIVENHIDGPIKYETDTDVKQEYPAAEKKPSSVTIADEVPVKVEALNGLASLQFDYGDDSDSSEDGD